MNRSLVARTAWLALALAGCASEPEPAAPPPSVPSESGASAVVLAAPGLG